MRHHWPRTRFRELIGDFCAPAPVHLGNEFTAKSFNDPKVRYSGVPSGLDRNRSDAIQAAEPGGTVLVGLVRSILDLTTSSRATSPLCNRVSGERKRQLLRVAIIYNLRLNSDGSGGALPPLIAGKSLRRQSRRWKSGGLGVGRIFDQIGEFRVFQLASYNTFHKGKRSLRHTSQSQSSAGIVDFSKSRYA